MVTRRWVGLPPGRADRRQTGAHKIADRLMSRIRNPDRGQFAGPMQLGQVDRVATIGLDPISRFARDQRRSDDDQPCPASDSSR